MGCVSSKQAVSVTPAFEQLSGSVGNSGRSRVGSIDSDRKCVGSARKGSADSLSFRLGNLQKYVDGGDHVAAAGWPSWLSAVAGEAILGWVPLRADSYEKLEKIGQGTYSSVFRARDLETGRIVALKKVRFDNFEPESVRFMAREIAILRKLDHQNVIKLDGLITSRLSCSLYLVFEYMEHDITGLLSCPDVKFSDSQIKCYMKQLLSGLQHCHSRGVMHRDIKGSNLLVSNDGTLKVADFGLANFCNLGPLTSRVVTLWYRPPELLLGSTEYGASVDLWSVGCVFAELLLGKPILQGRTEVEQLHKIFKLCGSPPDEYWKRSKLPHATLFRPQQPYDSCLRETFKDFPKECVDLLESLLSIEPYKRGTASSALSSEYFSTKPYACDPSNLPVYPPSKEIDAKNREEAKRKKSNGRSRTNETRKPTRKALGVSKFAPVEVSFFMPESFHSRTAGTRVINRSLVSQDSAAQTHEPQKRNGDHVNIQKEELGVVPRASTKEEGGEEEEQGEEEGLHVKNASQGDIPFSGPLQVSTSSGFAWAKRRKDEAAPRSHTRSISRGNIFNPVEHCVALKNNEFRGNDPYEIAKLAVQNQWGRFERPDSFDASDAYHSQELSLALYQRDGLGTTRSDRGFQDQSEKVEFSGPLLSQSNRIDELLERHERQIRRAVRKSWFNREERERRRVSNNGGSRTNLTFPNGLRV